MPSYKVVFHNTDDFDALADKNPRYKNIRDSFAFADPKTGVAHIRQSPSVLFNEFTVIHELEHLVHKDDLHMDEFGIQHKKVFKEIIHPILKAASYALAPATSGLSLLYSPIANTSIAAQEGQRGLGRTFARSGAEVLFTTAGGLAGGPIGAGAGAGASTKLFGSPQGAKGVEGSGTWEQAGSAALQGGINWLALDAAGGANPQTGVPNTGAPATPTPADTSIFQQIADITTKGLKTLTDAGKTMLGLGTTGTAATPSAAAANAGKFGYKGFGGLTPLLAGGGLLAMASQQKTPEPPSYEEFIPPTQSRVTEELLGRLQTGASTPVGKAATNELNRLITSPFGEAYGPVNDPYVAEAKRQNQINYFGDEATGQAGLRSQIINRYNAMGHYEGRSGLLDAALARLDQDFLRGQNQLDQEAQFRASEFEKKSRFEAVRTALGLEEDQMRDLIAIAQQDVSIAALKYGIDVQDAQSLRDMFGRAGGMALAAGLLG